MRGQQIYTVIQAVHSLLYIVAKCHFVSVIVVCVCVMHLSPRGCQRWAMGMRTFRSRVSQVFEFFLCGVKENKVKKSSDVLVYCVLIYKCLGKARQVYLYSTFHTQW